ncbi:MAG TPA: serine protease, partial [Candidatus Glassbacteria bacterium]|nr:serine protease [Candidatus Glassbacteria bacterium]
LDEIERALRARQERSVPAAALGSIFEVFNKLPAKEQKVLRYRLGSGRSLKEIRTLTKRGQGSLQAVLLDQLRALRRYGLLTLSKSRMTDKMIARRTGLSLKNVRRWRVFDLLGSLNDSNSAARRAAVRVIRANKKEYRPFLERVAKQSSSGKTRRAATLALQLIDEPGNLSKHFLNGVMPQAPAAQGSSPVSAADVPGFLNGVVRIRSIEGLFKGSGTVFYQTPAAAYIMSAAHVTRPIPRDQWSGRRWAEVVLADGSRTPGEVVWEDGIRGIDLSLVRLPPVRGLAPILLGTLALFHRASQGTVTFLAQSDMKLVRFEEQEWGSMSDYEDKIVLAAMVERGTSGGPVIFERQLVGVIISGSEEEGWWVRPATVAVALPAIVRVLKQIVSAKSENRLDPADRKALTDALRQASWLGQGDPSGGTAGSSPVAAQPAGPWQAGVEVYENTRGLGVIKTVVKPVRQSPQGEQAGIVEVQFYGVKLAAGALGRNKITAYRLTPAVRQLNTDSLRPASEISADELARLRGLLKASSSPVGVMKGFLPADTAFEDALKGAEPYYEKTIKDL